jgi:ubiquinone/menaquinone biosynthesis C-methylase UbiE
MNKDLYGFSKYDHKFRWISYWHQVDEVLKLNPKEVLEIGVGNKTVSNYLKNQGVSMVTLDIDKELEPDIVASVLKIPLEDNSFDVVLCAEVLEHLPFGDFPRALKEMKRVTKKFIVLSLPQWGWMFYFGLKLPLLKKITIFFKIPGILKHKPSQEHHWEIDKRGYPLRKIKRIIRNCGFKILKDFIDPDSPYHHFFILEK